MWALVESNNITQVYARPKGLTIGDVNYPSNIFTMWSASELEALGIYEIVIDNSNLKDKEYYMNTQQSFNFASGTVTASYGTATALPLDDVLWTAEEETADETGTVVEGEVKQPGVRPPKLTIVDQQAYGLLQPNDWMVVKATETSGSVASNWTTYRAAVRTAANDMRTKINAVSTVDELAALYVYNDATPPVRPLGEFPDAPTS
jgi:hypothetical protein